MTRRRPCPPAPGPVEEYAQQFDPVFASVAQRRSFREYLQGLLLPRDRNKTLTGLANTEPVVGAQAPAVQRLQWFLAEGHWNGEAVNERRIALLVSEPALAPHADGVLVIDETGDRKDGRATDHVARQYLGSLGKTDNGIVAVTSLWADERVYYPLDVRPYTPACRLPQGQRDPTFRSKPQLAAALVARAVAAGIPFRAVVADCLYGDSLAFHEALAAAEVAYVLGLKPAKGCWAPADDLHTPQEAAQALAWESPEQPGAWQSIERTFGDGHTETWWAAELVFGPYGPRHSWRAVVATSDPSTFPPRSTWYVVTNLPHPDHPAVAAAPLPPADLAEVVRLYGLRTWVEQNYKQLKHELGWADFMVRSDRAIRRHWQLVAAAASFCWWQHARATSTLPPPDTTTARPVTDHDHAGPAPPETNSPAAPPAPAVREKTQPAPARLVAEYPARRPRLARSLDPSPTLLAGLVDGAPAPGAPGSPRRRRRGTPAQPLRPTLTKYR